MTYLTPDFVALRTEAEHYAKQHPRPWGAGFMRGRGFRGEHIPMLTAAPIPPLNVKDYNPRVLGPTPGPGAVTISPWDEAYQDSDRGPGAMSGMGAAPVDWAGLSKSLAPQLMTAMQRLTAAPAAPAATAAPGTVPPTNPISSDQVTKSVGVAVVGAALLLLLRKH